MSAVLGLLRSQKRTVELVISGAKSNISDVEDKIERLKAAVKELEAGVEDMEAIKKSIDNLTVDEASWKGKNKDKFEDHYSEYQDAVETCISKTKDAKETMEEEITRYEQQRTNFITGLNNLENTLISLEKQIRKLEAEQG